MKKQKNNVLEKKAKKDKQEKQIRNFLLVMFFLFVLVIVVYLFVQASLKFSYAGLEFEKVREGDLILYRSNTLPIFLRNDPRDLRKIKIDDRIILKKNIGISGDKELIEGCSDSTVAATNLAIFFNGAGLKTFSATTNKTQAKEANITYIDCGLNSDYSAIIFKKNDTNSITKEGDCYVLNVNNCDIIKVAERFIVGSYANSRGIII